MAAAVFATLNHSAISSQGHIVITARQNCRISSSQFACALDVHYFTAAVNGVATNAEISCCPMRVLGRHKGSVKPPLVSTRFPSRQSRPDIKAMHQNPTGLLLLLRLSCSDGACGATTSSNQSVALVAG